MRPAEEPAEITGVGNPDPLSDLRDREIRFGKQRPGRGHAAFDDPVADGASGAAPHDGGQVPRRHAQFAGHVAQRQRLAEAPVDHLEHLGQQRFTGAP